MIITHITLTTGHCDTFSAKKGNAPDTEIAFARRFLSRATDRPEKIEKGVMRGLQADIRLHGDSRVITVYTADNMPLAVFGIFLRDSPAAREAYAMLCRTAVTEYPMPAVPLIATVLLPSIIAAPERGYDIAIFSQACARASFK